jgi:predicted acetyltransferase
MRLVDARTDERSRTWLTSAFVDYIRDLIAVGGEYEIIDGEAQPNYLPYWLENEFCFPLVAWRDHTPVGFVFLGVRPFPYMDASSDVQISEFFVASESRRQQIGQAVLLAALEKVRGTCELSVLKRNERAHAFWRNALTRAGLEFLEVESDDSTTFTFACVIEQPS